MNSPNPLFSQCIVFADIRHDEHIVWDMVLPTLGPLKDNVRRLIQHGFTEIFNNAISHSTSKEALVSIEKTDSTINITICDSGIGIFNNLISGFDLIDERHAVLELIKGKQTTDSKDHAGEGIFFSSRAFDQFKISSGSTSMIRAGDRLTIDKNSTKIDGTCVSMTIDINTSKVLGELFDQFSEPEIQPRGIFKTNIPVVIVLTEGSDLISRSQAKRLLARLEDFREVILDFAGVDFIGQGFSDEIFRVFVNRHPGTRIITQNICSQVAKMIAWVGGT